MITVESKTGTINAHALIKLTALWIILAVLFGGMAAGRNFLRYRDLANQGVKASGTVTRLDRDNHRTVHYTYSVSARPFEGRGHGGFGNQEFENLRVGDVVSVSYLPNAEDASCLGDPRELLRHTERFMLSAAIIFPTLVLFFYYQLNPSFRAWVIR